VETRDDLRERQLARLRRVLAVALPGNRFYARKFAGHDPRTWDDFTRLPFTTKAELAADQLAAPPYGTALSFPPDHYPRLHQTSGTSTGKPLRWLDTAESWDWLVGCWATKFEMMRLTPRDRAFFAFSFGPFLGFWAAFEATARFGMLTLPGGGMTTTARLRFLLEHRATVVCCTPTYALHLAEVAAAERLDLAGSAVRVLVVAGEPGGSIPATKERIESAWGARLYDHYGMTEVGPVSCECYENPGGMHVLEEQYIAEVLDPATGQAVPDQTEGELVLTNLGRTGSPLIRYRTGDVVRGDRSICPCGRSWLRLVGGVRGRTDDMIHVRGNNLYPSAVEAVIRRFPQVAEFRLVVERVGELTDLRVEIEPTVADGGTRLAETVARAIRDELLFRVPVACVPPGSLPRFEMKARRITVVAK
jgi:phenylacetate-CoA ligase